MAQLSAKRREKLPAKDFGLPEKARTADDKRETGNYPMPDKAHARNAKARSSQQYKAGNLTKAERDRIHRKADKVLGKTAKKKTKAAKKKKSKKKQKAAKTKRSK
jgi:hypothetical protein